MENISPYKRSEIIFVKDGDCHNYCIHQDDKENFYRWDELLSTYWDDNENPSLYNYDEWMKLHSYNGKNFETYAIGCHPNYYLEITEFKPE